MCMLLPDQLAGGGRGREHCGSANTEWVCFACFRGRPSSKLTSNVPATAKQGSSKSVLLGRDHYAASSSVIEQIVGSPDSEICEQTTMPSGRSC